MNDCLEKKKKKKKGVLDVEQVERMVFFSSVPLFTTRKREVIAQSGTMRIDHLMRRKAQGAVIVKIY